MSPYFSDIVVIRVVFCRRDHECDALIELDTSQGGDAHVQKNTKEHSQRNVPQHICHHNGHACRFQKEVKKF